MKKVFLSIFVGLTLVLIMSTTVFAISGEGTEVSPFIIENTDDFLLIGYFPTQHFKLKSDIYLETTLENFSGFLDGNGFKITTTKDYVFSSNLGRIINLSIDGGKIAQINEESGSIENCIAKDTIVVTTNNGKLYNTTSNLSVVESNNGTIKKCSTTSGYIANRNNNSGIISECKDVFHIANYNYGLVENSTSVDNYLIQTNYGIIINCSSTNSFLVSLNNGTIKSCFSTGESFSVKVTSSSSFIKESAFVRNNAESGIIELCYSDLNISVAGNKSDIFDTAVEQYIGGLVAYNKGKISRSYYSGIITGNISNVTRCRGYDKCYIGGISGYNTGTISRCFSLGNITSTFTVNSSLGCASSIVTGGVTACGGAVDNSYSDMIINVEAKSGNHNVFSYAFVFGIGGDCKVTNCYFIGDLTKTTVNKVQYEWGYPYYDSYNTVNDSGISGSYEKEFSFENSYYLSNTPFDDDTTCGTPASASIMKMQTYYNEWDFATIWSIDSNINNGYPHLKWEPEKEEIEETIYVESIVLDKEELFLKIGEQIMLTATLAPDNATNQNVLWSSSNNEVVTVTDGIVTTVGEGIATIIARTEDGGYIALCSVEVTKPIITKPILSVEDYNKTSNSITFVTNLFSPTDITGTVLVALYEEDCSLVMTKTYSATSKINVSLDSISGKYIKIMWWDTKKLTPLVDYVKVDI